MLLLMLENLNIQTFEYHSKAQVIWLLIQGLSDCFSSICWRVILKKIWEMMQKLQTLSLLHHFSWSKVINFTVLLFHFMYQDGFCHNGVNSVKKPGAIWNQKKQVEFWWKRLIFNLHQLHCRDVSPFFISIPLCSLPSQLCFSLGASCDLSMQLLLHLARNSHLTQWHCIVIMTCLCWHLNTQKLKWGGLQWSRNKSNLKSFAPPYILLEL